MRGLLLLVEVADTVTRSCRSITQLPRLIELIVTALDAERATLFLHDAETGELFSRIAQGEGMTEIRIRATTGIAGAVFGSGTTEIVADAYQRPSVQSGSGPTDRISHARHPLRAAAQSSRPNDRRDAGFEQAVGLLQRHRRRLCLEAINRQAASALEQAQLVEQLDRLRREEEQLLAITEAISTELRIDPLLARIVHAATGLLDAERSTLFIYDAASDELWSKVAEGAGETQIRIPAKAGIAGAAFTSGEVLNVPDAYAHPLFNPHIDRQSGFRTRNLLNVPVVDRAGEHLGVVQVLNKRGGPFTHPTSAG